MQQVANNAQNQGGHQYGNENEADEIRKLTPKKIAEQQQREEQEQREREREEMLATEPNWFKTDATTRLFREIDGGT